LYQELLKNLEPFTERTAKRVTDAPVSLVVGRFRDKSDMARLVKYKSNSRGKKKGVAPIKYEVAVSRQAINKIREKFPKTYMREMKKIIAHELAHIKHPDRHTKAFKMECRRLGGCNRCIRCGVD
jgi:hypothetical protein